MAQSDFIAYQSCESQDCRPCLLPEGTNFRCVFGCPKPHKPWQGGKAEQGLDATGHSCALRETPGRCCSARHTETRAAVITVCRVVFRRGRLSLVALRMVLIHAVTSRATRPLSGFDSWTQSYQRFKRHLGSRNRKLNGKSSHCICPSG